FIEAVTYRYRGHSMADPGTYRTKEEVERWRQRDAIESFQLRLKEAGLATDEDFQAHEDDVTRIVQETVDFADSSPEPDPETDLRQHVYGGDVAVSWRS
ncbi:MAG: pyruvate dehydrogenase (acetyl-transferring) E1 component subunit alpha, partial [Chloroflexi bacterium]|nr:pyruvate dehydrogenase (acetyl-transferring) E1 component subunit alpha [Chloroflexota bacterium]